MNISKKLISALLVTAAIGTSIASAQSIDGTNTDTSKPSPGGINRDFDLAKRQKVISLIEAGDYVGWKAQMIQAGHTRVADKVTADQFAKMTEIAQAVKSKDWAKVKELRKKLPPTPLAKKHRMLKKLKHSF